MFPGPGVGPAWPARACPSGPGKMGKCRPSPTQDPPDFPGTCAQAGLPGTCTLPVFFVSEVLDLELLHVPVVAGEGGGEDRRAVVARAEKDVPARGRGAGGHPRPPRG